MVRRSVPAAVGPCSCPTARPADGAGVNVAFICGKGGVGKSTLCYLTGLALANAGHPVRVRDRDPQRSITSWIRPERDGITVEPGDPGGAAGGVVGGARLIDTCPYLRDPGVAEAARAADVIVMPVGPSPADMGVLHATIELVNHLKRPDARAMIGLNQVQAGTKWTRRAAELLRDCDAPVARTAIPQRMAFRNAIVSGWSALDAKQQGGIFRLAVGLLMCDAPAQAA